MYIYISQTFAFILCPHLTMTFCSWLTGYLTVCQGVVRWHSIYSSNFVCADTPNHLCTLSYSDQVTECNTWMVFDVGKGLKPCNVTKPFIVKFDVHNIFRQLCGYEVIEPRFEWGEIVNEDW